MGSTGERVLVVDDDPDAREVLAMRLQDEGYQVSSVVDGYEALDAIEEAAPDLVLLDVNMPGLDGFETLRRIKTKGVPFIPTILVTARGDSTDIVDGLNAGADEYISKPFDHAALVARVRAMLRLKEVHDELAELNASLEHKVAEQVEEIQRVSRLKRFLAPQIAEAILASPDGDTVLASHRRDVAVLFCDLRGFTAFAEAASPTELMALLREYHDAVGALIFEYGGTLERFAGDSIMVIFNDPLEVPNYRQRASELAFRIIGECEPLLAGRRKRGFKLGVGIGIASGPATLGRIGYRDRLDYAAIGSVTNLAARLSDVASASEILTDSDIAHGSENCSAVTLGPQDIKGFSKPVDVFRLQRPTRAAKA